MFSPGFESHIKRVFFFVLKHTDFFRFPQLRVGYVPATGFGVK